MAAAAAALAALAPLGEPRGAASAMAVVRTGKAGGGWPLRNCRHPDPRVAFASCYGFDPVDATAHVQAALNSSAGESISGAHGCHGHHRTHSPGAARWSRAAPPSTATAGPLVPGQK